MNATALPTPSGVASAWWKESPYLLVVSNQRWTAVVQMTRIRVRTLWGKISEVIDYTGKGPVMLTAEKRKVQKVV